MKTISTVTFTTTDPALLTVSSGDLASVVGGAYPADSGPGSSMTTSPSGTSLTCPSGTSPHHTEISGNGSFSGEGGLIKVNGNIKYTDDRCDPVK